jgi:hypothetical protein
MLRDGYELLKREGLMNSRICGMIPLKTNTIRGAIFPEAKKVAGPIMQERLGGHKKVPQHFHEKAWTEKGVPGEKAVLLLLTETEWMALGERWKQDHLAEKRKGVKPAPKPAFNHRPFEALQGFKAAK